MPVVKKRATSTTQELKETKEIKKPDVKDKTGSILDNLNSDDIILLIIIIILILNNCEDKLLLLALGFIFFSDYLT